MLSGKPWRIDAVLLLGSGLLLSIAAGGIFKIFLDQSVPKLNGASFYSFLVSVGAFQGVGLILVHFFLKAHEVTWREFLGLAWPRWKWALQLALAMAIFAIPTTLLLNTVAGYVIKALDQNPTPQVVMQVLNQTVGWGQRACFGFTAIVVAPIVEESLFRGILYRWLKQYGYPALAVLGSSVLFAASHGSLLTFVPLTFLAVMLVLLYEKTDALIAPIIAHALFNAVNFTLFFVVPKAGFS